jgi:hypothetical protein
LAVVFDLPVPPRNECTDTILDISLPPQKAIIFPGCGFSRSQPFNG